MNSVIPERLKQARIQAGLSLSQAATLLVLPRDYLQEIEFSKQWEMADVRIAKFAEVYGVSEAWLRGEEKPLELTPEHLDQLAKLSPADRDSIIDFLTSLRG